MNQQQRIRRSFRADFHRQMVKLYQQGKSRSELVRQYDLTPSTLDRWINQSSKSGSFKTKDNRTLEENELIA
ncbi:MAG: transposase [Snodgrassella sp.]|nr:transposase [Snodgrassella sp.]